MTTFTSFGLPSFLNESLELMGIHVPTPIQAKAILPGLEGHDILASAQTGTGKTLTYLIPLVTNLLKDSHSTALVLAPTRELAAQIQESARALLGKKMSFGMALLIGGDPMHKQLSALKRHPRLIVGTPGRINDHLARGTLRLQETRFLVLDETDRMLDMGFTEALKKIVHYLPKERQTFMFSATMPPSIKTLSLTYLTNPKHISVGSTTAPSLQITQQTLHTSTAEKYATLLNELDAREGSVIIFVKTKHGADRLADKLNRENHFSAAIHGDLKQRKREEVIRDFKNLKHRIMVATDLAARGLDIPHIKHVINYDLPQCPEDYIHRIGRTGRAGMEGWALSLVSPEDNQKWRRIHSLINPGKALPAGAMTDPEGSERRSKPRSYNNSERPSRGRSFDKSADSDRRGSYNNSERPSRGRSFDKPADSDRRGSYNNSERPSRGRSFDKPADSDRRGSYQNSERPARERSFDRPADSDRRGSYQNSERPARGRSFDKPADSDRRGSYQNSERPARGRSFDKPADSDRRGSYQNSERPARERSFDRPADSDRRGSYQNSERPAGDRPYGKPANSDRRGPYQKPADSDRRESYQNAERPARGKAFAKPTDAKRAGSFKRAAPKRQQSFR